MVVIAMAKPKKRRRHLSKGFLGLKVGYQIKGQKKSCRTLALDVFFQLMSRLWTLSCRENVCRNVPMTSQDSQNIDHGMPNLAISPSWHANVMPSLAKCRPWHASDMPCLAKCRPWHASDMPSLAKCRPWHANVMPSLPKCRPWHVTSLAKCRPWHANDMPVTCQGSQNVDRGMPMTCQCHAKGRKMSAMACQ